MNNSITTIKLYQVRGLWEVGKQSLANYGLTPVRKLKFYGLVPGEVHGVLNSVYF